MRALIGVKSWRDVNFTGASLKLEALLFDQVIFPDIDLFARLEFSKEQIRERFGLLPWLEEKGLVSLSQPDANLMETDTIWPIAEELSRIICRSAQLPNVDSYNDIQIVEFTEKLLRSLDESNRQGLLRRLTPYLPRYRFCTTQLAEFATRVTSAKLKKERDLDAYPIVPAISPPTVPEGTSKSHIVQIFLKTLPVPDHTVSWEEILNYRSDADSLKKFRALKNWMNEVARSSLSPHEIEDKLDYLMHEYQQHLELHRLKTKVGVFETLVVTTAEAIENMVKFNWGSIAKTLFALKHRQIDLLECELNAPGREVAYIVKAQDTF
jgi:hypothetical protein